MSVYSIFAVTVPIRLLLRITRQTKYFLHMPQNPAADQQYHSVYADLNTKPTVPFMLYQPIIMDYSPRTIANSKNFVNTTAGQAPHPLRTPSPRHPNYRRTTVCEDSDDKVDKDTAKYYIIELFVTITSKEITTLLSGRPPNTTYQQPQLLLYDTLHPKTKPFVVVDTVPARNMQLLHETFISAFLIGPWISCKLLKIA